MWMRASARQAPPTRYRSRPTPSLNQGTAARSASAMARARIGSPPDRSDRRITPSRSVWEAPRVPRCNRTTSSEPPPISARMPSAVGMPHTTPSADNSASCVPGSTRIGTSGMRDCSSFTKSGPLLASRTAAVASTSNGWACIARATA
jgi:hypothetical protein